VHDFGIHRGSCFFRLIPIPADFSGHKGTIKCQRLLGYSEQEEAMASTTHNHHASSDGPVMI
jgi:hypothetical protein